jgi:hypothetical protein
MRILTLEQKIKLYSGTMSVALLLVVTTVIYPSWRAVGYLQEEITQTETALEEEYNRSRELQRSLRELDRVQKATEIFSSAYIVPGDELSFITTLEQMAEDADITQTLSIQDGGESLANPAMKPYTISFSLQGDFAKIMAYLQTLETAPFMLRIPSITLAKTAVRGETQSTLSLSFDAYVYTQPK